MKPTLISHPLKRIQFHYNSEASLSDFETAFIDRYKHLHDELETIKTQLLQLGPDIQTVMAELENATKFFENLKAIIVQTERKLGLAPAGEIMTGEYRIKPGEIQKALDEFQATRNDYWDIMVPMYKLFNKVFERFTAFDNTVEQFEKEFSQPLFRNSKTLEIDIRCFDQDMNEFRIEWMAIANLQDDCLDEYNQWAKQQAALVNNSEMLYDRIKKLFQHISNIQNSNGGDSGNEFGLN